MSLYSNNLGVAIAQNTYATDSDSEIQALRQLLDRVELSGLLVQGRRAACEPPFFLYLEQRGADILIAVKHSRRRGLQIIRDRLTYDRKAVCEITHRERKHGCEMRWTLRGMPAPVWVTGTGRQRHDLGGALQRQT